MVHLDDLVRQGVGDLEPQDDPARCVRDGEDEEEPARGHRGAGIERGVEKEADPGDFRRVVKARARRRWRRR